jgi:hypothetical protein
MITVRLRRWEIAGLRLGFIVETIYRRTINGTEFFDVLAADNFSLS